MTMASIVAFTTAFFILSLIPGPGLAAILSRTMSGGIASGLRVTAGLVVGDALFLSIAVLGLSALASTMGPLFQIVKYVGAAYLIWLGYRAFTAPSTAGSPARAAASTPSKDVGVGLLVTLGNPKPILFYGALLPTFLDVTAIGPIDVAILLTIVAIVSFVVYGAWMVLVDRARRVLASTRAMQRFNRAAGTLLIGSGLVIATR